MRTFSMMLATALIVIGAGSASAQTPAGVPPAPGRLTLFVNGGLQIASQDIQRASTFELYDEQGEIDIAQDDVEGGGYGEIGGSFRFFDRIGAGASYMFVSSSAAATVSGLAPHPLVFDQFRPFSASADGLDHEEQIVHVFATWHMPLTEKVDLTFSAGPSFFNISQDFLRTVVFSETPPFTTIAVDSVEVTRMQQNGIGFNIGADATYQVTRVMGFDLGIGAAARFSRGSADFKVTDSEEVSVKGGGFQISAGLRARF